MKEFKEAKETRRRDGDARAFLQRFSEGTGEGMTAAAARGDTRGSESSEQGNAADNARGGRENDAEFEKLIRGTYKESFTRRTQEIIDKRFAQSKKDAARLESLAPALDALRERYGLSDETGLTEAILKEAADAKDEALRRNAQEKLRLQQSESAKSAWRAEAAALRDIYSAFDLDSELTGNPTFAKLLQAGAGVRQAYEAAHLPEILSSAMRYAAKKAGEKAVNALRVSAQRPQENGVMNRAATLARTDVGSLSEREILKIIDAVGRGAKISF